MPTVWFIYMERMWNESARSEINSFTVWARIIQLNNKTQSLANVKRNNNNNNDEKKEKRICKLYQEMFVFSTYLEL